jgi:hypothetical protein
MSKIQNGLVSLCLLTAFACQPVSQIAQAPAKLSQGDYSRQVASLFKDYGKTNLEGVNTSSIALSMALGAGLSTTTPALPTSSLTVPSVLSDSAKSSLMDNSELQKKSLEGSLKALKNLKNKLQSLIPPPEAAEKHAQILQFFSLNDALTEKMQKEVDFSTIATFKQGLESFRKNHKSEFESLEKQAPAVMEIFADFTLESYRAESLGKQQGASLDRAAYQEKLKALFAKNKLGNPMSFLFPTMLLSGGRSGSGAGDTQGQDLKVQVQKYKDQLQTLRNEFAALHPPDELQSAHLTLYTGLSLAQSLQNRILDFMLQKFSTGSDATKQNPLVLFSELFNDTELMAQMVSFMPLMGKLQKVMAELK